MHKFSEGIEALKELDELCTKKGVVNPDTDGGTKNALQRATANLVPQEHPMPFHIFRSPSYVSLSWYLFTYSHCRETSIKEYSICTHETPTSVFSGYLTPNQAKAVDDIQSLDPHV
jgi:hypothetical protein